MIVYAMALPERYDIACGVLSVSLLAARAWEALLGGLYCLLAVGVLFACLGFYEILCSCRSISTAPVRGGSHFLCCCKESNQRKQLLPA